MRAPTGLKHERSAVLYPPGELSVHATLISVGYSRETTAAYDWHGLKRGPGPFAIVQLTLTGFGILRYENWQRRVEPGSVMLLTVPHDHRYYLPEDSNGWEFLYVCFSGTEALRVVEHVIQARGPLWDLDKDSNLYRHTEEIVRRSQRGLLKSPWQASALAYGLAMALLEPIQTKDVVQRPRPIELAVKLLDENWKSDISVEALAEQVGYTRSHLTRLFKTHVGVGPGEYLDRLRLQHAVAQLQDGTRSVKQIAFDCGFSDPHYFSKVFKRQFGTTPSEVRRSGIV